jgi:hypothetical protein
MDVPEFSEQYAREAHAAAECSRMQQNAAECSRMQQNAAGCSRVQQKVSNVQHCPLCPFAARDAPWQNLRKPKFPAAAFHEGFHEGSMKTTVRVSTKANISAVRSGRYALRHRPG